MTMTERELLLHFTGYSAFGSGHEYVFGVRSGVTQCRGRRVRNRVIERKKRKKSRDDRQREREEQKCGEPKRKAITRVHPAVGKPGLIWWDTVLSATRSYQLDGAFAVQFLRLSLSLLFLLSLSLLLLYLLSPLSLFLFLSLAFFLFLTSSLRLFSLLSQSL